MYQTLLIHLIHTIFRVDNISGIYYDIFGCSFSSKSASYEQEFGVKQSIIVTPVQDYLQYLS